MDCIHAADHEAVKKSSNSIKYWYLILNAYRLL